MRTVLIVLFDRVQSLDVTGPLEVFAGANRWQSGREHSPAGPDGPDGPAYQIRTASLGGRPRPRRHREHHALPQPLHPHRFLTPKHQRARPSAP